MDFIWPFLPLKEILALTLSLAHANPTFFMAKPLNIYIYIYILRSRSRDGLCLLSLCVFSCSEKWGGREALERSEIRSNQPSQCPFSTSCNILSISWPLSQKGRLMSSLVFSHCTHHFLASAGFIPQLNPSWQVCYLFTRSASPWEQSMAVSEREGERGGRRQKKEDWEAGQGNVKRAAKDGYYSCWGP